MSEQPAARTKQTLKITLGLAVLFGSGIVVGVVGTKLYVHRELDRLFTGGPGAITEAITDHITNELELDNAQRERVFSVVESTQLKLYVLRLTIKDSIRLTFQQAAKDVEAELTPAQKARWKLSDEAVAAALSRVDTYWQSRGIVDTETSSSEEARPSAE